MDGLRAKGGEFGPSAVSGRRIWVVSVPYATEQMRWLHRIFAIYNLTKASGKFPCTDIVGGDDAQVAAERSVDWVVSWVVVLVVVGHSNSLDASE